MKRVGCDGATLIRLNLKYRGGGRVVRRQHEGWDVLRRDHIELPAIRASPDIGQNDRVPKPCRVEPRTHAEGGRSGETLFRRAARYGIGARAVEGRGMS